MCFSVLFWLLQRQYPPPRICGLLILSLLLHAAREILGSPGCQPRKADATDHRCFTR